MNNKILLRYFIALMLFLGGTYWASAQSCNIITTIAGTGAAGFSGDGGAATSAHVYDPYNVTTDRAGNVYIADSHNHRIRKVDTSGIIYTVAGTGSPGFSGDGGPATAAMLNTPYSMKFDASGNMYIADFNNQRIRIINTSGIITTIAGNGTAGFSGDGGPATAAKMNQPEYIALDPSGNIYVSDGTNERIRIISSSGIINTFAGNGTAGYSGDGAAATAAELQSPKGIDLDASGNLYIADAVNNRVRVIDVSGIIHTFAGTGSSGFSGDGGPASAATLTTPFDIKFDAGGTAFIADAGNYRIRTVSTSGIINTVAGNGSYGFSGDGGPATAAEFKIVTGLWVDSAHNMYIADYYNNRVRKVTSGNPVVGAITGATSVAVGSTITLGDTSIGGTWSSSDTTIATVSGGAVSGFASGMVTISYAVSNSCGTTVATFRVTVMAASAFSCSNTITTIAGTGSLGYGGDGGAATSAIIYYPWNVTTDISGNVYIADAYNNRIRKVDITGVITTFAGTGTSAFGGDGGPATAANLGEPTGMKFDASGNMYIVDYYNNRIRKVAPSGIISTIAGNGTAGFSGDGGPATAAELNNPEYLALDRHGNIYVADLNNQRIRVISTAGIINTLAGNGTAGFSGDGGAATAAKLNNPSGIDVDASGNLYIADYLNNRIRIVDASGIINTFAGTGLAGFSGDGGPASAAKLKPTDIKFDAMGTAFVSDYGNQRVRTITTAGIINTVAGYGSWGFSGDGGPATAAEIHFAPGVWVDASDNIFIADQLNSRVRKVTSSNPIIGVITGATTVALGSSITLADTTIGGTWSSSDTTIATVSGGAVRGITVGAVTITYAVSNSCGTSVATYRVTVTAASASSCSSIISTIAGRGIIGFSGDGGAATSAGLSLPWYVTTDASGNIYIADVSDDRIRKVDPSGIISTFAGTGVSGFSGDGGPATAAKLSAPRCAKFDASGNLYIVDNFNNRIRKVNTAGIISTLAGNGTAGFSGDGGPATAAEINSPNFLAIDGSGNVYISDEFNNRIRVVSSSGTINTFAGNGTVGFSGDGGPATAAEFQWPEGISVDGSGNVYISDYYNYRIRVVDASGVINTFAGNGSYGFAGDGGPATAARLGGMDIAFDASGNAFVTDVINSRIRKINTAGIISTIAGNGTAGYSGDGGAATAAEMDGITGLWVDAGNNILIADQNNNRIRKLSPGYPTAGTISGATTVAVGSSITLTDTTIGGTWSCSDTTIATISGGAVSGIAVGGVTITYAVSNSCGTSVATYNVTVTAAVAAYSCSIITTIAGNGAAVDSGDGGAALAAGINLPLSVAADHSGNIYVAEPRHNRVRKISNTGIVSTFAGTGTAGFSGDGGPASAAQLRSPSGVTLDASGNLYIADEYNSRIRMVDPSGTISTYAGTGTAGFSGDGGPATAAAMYWPFRMAFDVSGNLYVADIFNQRIRKITPGGIISTIAGNGTLGFSGDGGSATTAQLYNPASVAVDPSGNVYIVDHYNNRIRVVNSAGIIKTFAGNGTSGYGGDGGQATNAPMEPIDITFDPGGTLYFCDQYQDCIRKIAASGIVTRFAGNDTAGFSGDGGAATAAELYTPTGLTFDDAGNLIIADQNNNRIRKIGQPIITAGVIAGGAVVCIGDSITLTDSANGGSWSSSNIAFATVSTSGVVHGVSSGIDTISYTISSVCGTFVASQAITVISIPNPGNISGPDSLCPANTIALTDTTSGGVWSSVALSIATINTSGTVTGVAPGTATISYSLANSCGTAAATASIVVKPLPDTGIISGASGVCLGASTTLSESVAGGSWSSSASGIATVSASGVVTGIVRGAATISYAQTNSCGTATETQVITVDTLPVVTPISGVSALCVGMSTGFTTTNTGGMWSTGSPSVATITVSGVVTGIANGTTAISYSKRNGCSTVSATQSISVMLPPTAIITPMGDTLLCPGDLVGLTASTGYGYTYQWFLGPTSISGATDDFYVADTTGAFKVAINNSCAAVSIPMHVSINPASATLTTGDPTRFCSGSGANLMANTGAGLSYQWLSSGVGISGAASVNYYASAAGDYTVIVSNAAGCTALSSDINITVLPSPTASLAASGPLSFCPGDSVTLTADTVSGLLYQWQNVGVAIAGATNISYSTSVSGNYNVVETNGYYCSDTSVVVAVNLLSPPAATVAAVGDTVFCTGSSVLLDGTAGSGYTYQWYKNGATIAGAIIRGYYATITGNYTLRVTSAAGCASTSYPGIAIHELSAGDITPSAPATFCWGGSLLLGINGTTTSLGYQWQQRGTNITGATNSSYLATTSGNYSCIVTIPGVCTIATYDESVTVLPLPNPIITFNGTSLSTGNYYVSYQWYRDLVPLASRSSSVIPDATGDYTVRVIDSNGCQSVSTIYVLRSLAYSPSLGTSSLSNKQNDISLTVAPNPNSGVFNVLLSAANCDTAHLAVYNMVGEQVKECTIATNAETEISLDVPAGVYLVTAVMGSSKVWAKVAVE